MRTVRSLAILHLKPRAPSGGVVEAAGHGGDEPQAGGRAVDDVLGQGRATGRLMFVNFIFIFVLYCYRLSCCSQCTAVPLSPRHWPSKFIQQELVVVQDKLNTELMMICWEKKCDKKINAVQ